MDAFTPMGIWVIAVLGFVTLGLRVFTLGKPLPSCPAALRIPVAKKWFEIP